jgi:DNA-binding MarR family transcriptional regulator
MTPDQLKARAMFLLREAGPHRACELAEFVGCLTGDMERALTELRVAGHVEKLEVTSSITKWFVMRPYAVPT